MLDMLTRLGDTAAIERFLQGSGCGGLYAARTMPLSSGALEVLTPDFRFELVDRIVAADGGRCAGCLSPTCWPGSPRRRGQDGCRPEGCRNPAGGGVAGRSGT